MTFRLYGITGKTQTTLNNYRKSKTAGVNSCRYFYLLFAVFTMPK